MAEEGNARLTLADIAKSLGVSTATVSRVLNGHHHVREETRERILDYVRETGYTRIPVGPLQSFVGIIKRYAGTHYYSARLFAATATALEAQGFFPAVIDPHSLDHGPDIFEQTRAAALLKGAAWITSVPTETAKYLFRTHELPVVFVNQDYSDESFPSVISDNQEAAKKAVKYLSGRGHRRIGLLGSQLQLPIHRDRMNGFLAGMKEVGITPRDEWIVTDIHTEYLNGGGEDGIHRLMAQEHTPTAVVLMNDLLAPGAFRGARNLGYRVPEQLSFIAFGDSSYNEFLSPPLTTFQQPLEEMAQAAVSRLVSEITTGRKSEAPLLETFLMGMVVRGSVASPDHEEQRRT